jgi:antitoxin VapB
MGSEHHVKFFRRGGEQVVVIPAEFEMPSDEAIMRKEGERLVIEPARTESDNLIAWLQAQPPLDDSDLDFDFDEKGPLPRDVDL